MERLEKNFIWMAAANIIGSLFSVTLFIYLARTLRAEAFGAVSYAHSFIFYLLNFVDLGLSTYGIREVAKNRVRVSEYVSEIVSFKLLIAGSLFIVLTAATFLSCPSAGFRMIMFGASLLLFVSALSTEWAYQGQEKMHMVFLSFVTTTLLQFLMVWAFVKGPRDLLKATPVYSLAAFLIPILFLIHFKYKPKLDFSYLKQIKRYLASSLIIWLIAIFAQVYNGLDIVLLGLFKSPEEVGYFTIARRAIGGCALLMVFLANALLPRLSATFSNDVSQFNSATGKFLKVSSFLTVFVFLPLIALSDHIISFALGGEYLPACLPFKIMGLGLIIVLFNLPFSTGLVAAGKEKEVLKQVLASASLSVILNIFLMPEYGMMGAAISFVFAEILAIIWILWAYRKHILACQPS
ncbi:MAG: flippase [Candidatus Omnitrophica bacterium]|nr:flippase [Candidatus Omnitrophota bacterium]